MLRERFPAAHVEWRAEHIFLRQLFRLWPARGCDPLCGGGGPGAGRRALAVEGLGGGGFSWADLNRYFCGSYFGYGLHEDAIRSAVEVARGLGVEPWR